MLDEIGGGEVMSDNGYPVTADLSASPHSFDKGQCEAMRPTIFALSSGRAPAAVAVVRVCGPKAELRLRR